VVNPVEAASRQRELLLRIVRIAFLALMLTVTLLFVIEVGEQATPEGQGLPFELATRWWLPLGAAIALCGLFLTADLLTPNKKIQTVAGVIFGLVAGLIATLAFGFVIDLVATSWEIEDATIVDASKVLLGISLVLPGHHDGPPDAGRLPAGDPRMWSLPSRSGGRGRWCSIARP
jgi:hypothetical protein